MKKLFAVIFAYLLTFANTGAVSASNVSPSAGISNNKTETLHSLSSLSEQLIESDSNVAIYSDVLDAFERTQLQNADISIVALDNYNDTRNSFSATTPKAIRIVEELPSQIVKTSLAVPYKETEEGILLNSYIYDNIGAPSESVSFVDITMVVTTYYQRVDVYPVGAIPLYAEYRWYKNSNTSSYVANARLTLVGHGERYQLSNNQYLGIFSDSVEVYLRNPAANTYHSTSFLMQPYPDGTSFLRFPSYFGGQGIGSECIVTYVNKNGVTYSETIDQTAVKPGQPIL